MIVASFGDVMCNWLVTALPELRSEKLTLLVGLTTIMSGWPPSVYIYLQGWCAKPPSSNRTAACHHADEIILSPLRASRASEPLGSYSSRMIVEPSPAGAWLLIVSCEMSQQFTGFAIMPFGKMGLLVKPLSWPYRFWRVSTLR